MPDRAYVIDQMISAKAIAARVETLAIEIKQKFCDCDQLVEVDLLRGSFVFIADLVRELKRFALNLRHSVMGKHAKHSYVALRFAKNTDSGFVRNALDMNVEVNFLETSSYGNATESSREVHIIKDLRGKIEGRYVLVVEDIVDTGHTLSHVLHLLESRHPRKLRTIALLDKPSRREADIKADWIGFEIPDEFVVGYGIDFAQRNRNLPCIGKDRFTEE